ncbi:hypothetical protein F4677DRAFT_23358 [Hypoxylon crocopeplum]|nr:hypothetical protein F4677DRAFT_23358 [Hypoxylon crocopeplum]
MTTSSLEPLCWRQGESDEIRRVLFWRRRPEHETVEQPWPMTVGNRCPMRISPHLTPCMASSVSTAGILVGLFPSFSLFSLHLFPQAGKYLRNPSNQFEAFKGRGRTAHTRVFIAQGIRPFGATSHSAVRLPPILSVDGFDQIDRWILRGPF